MHFASAMNLLELRDGDRSSYAEIADVIQREGEHAEDARELFRRMVFNITINNVDDHLRNHGFLRGRFGWHLSPALDWSTPDERRHVGGIVRHVPTGLHSLVDDVVSCRAERDASAGGQSLIRLPSC